MVRRDSEHTLNIQQSTFASRRGEPLAIVAIFAAATLVIVHRTLLRAGVPRFGRITASLALGFHPIFLWSSCTFMTEVPFVFASSVALYAFIRAFEDDDGSAWIVAACAATMT